MLYLDCEPTVVIHTTPKKDAARPRPPQTMSPWTLPMMVIATATLSTAIILLCAVN